MTISVPSNKASVLQVGVITDIQIDKEEHSSDLMRRVHASFVHSKLGDLSVRFTMVDGLGKKTSSVERAIRRFPELKRFEYAARPWPQAELERQIGNDLRSPLCGELVEFPTLLEIVSRVPHSFPFFSVSIRLTHPAFGPEPHANTPRNLWPGVVIEDSWGITRRRVSLTAVAVVDADPASDAMLVLAPPAAAVLYTCGKPKLTRQTLLPGQRSDVADKVSAIAQDLKVRMEEVVRQARLPHAFSEEVDQPPAKATGIRKPVLARAFQPLGYDCHGGTMMVLTCRRRTAFNLVVELHIDFGGRGDVVHPTYSVHGLGFSASIKLPVSLNSISRTLHWLVDAARWQQIVENLAALVAELDGTFLSDIEAAAGPSPAWYRPITVG